MSTQSWSFFRAGGVDQVNLTRGADLMALDQLDQKLWVALACPVNGLEFDTRTLALIDTDGDKRVQAPELIAAAKWAGGLLSDVEQLARAGQPLSLASIQRGTPEGALVHQTATTLLASLGKAGASTLSVDEISAAITAFQQQTFNGDGVITPASAHDEATRAVLTEALAATASPPLDRNGSPGLNSEAVAAFYDALAAFAAWREAGQSPEVLPLGADTEAAWAALGAIAPKVDDFFSRARIAAFDARAIPAMNAEEAAFVRIAQTQLSAELDTLRELPLASVSPDAALPLRAGVNPSWAGAIEALNSKVVLPLLGERDSLSRAEWEALRARLAPYGAWLAAKAGASVESLGEARVRALLADDSRAQIEALIAQDLEQAPQAAALETVEKLTRFCRDLMPLANNFVSFREFYGRKGPAIFQVGTLYIDQRSCELCLQVNDAGRHASLGPLSKAFLLYCELRNDKGQTRSIVAAVTNGDTDNLMAGRNGLFYDRQGQDWDATITRIVDAPISVRQAFWSPYKKLISMVEGMINARAAAASAAADSRVTEAGGAIESASAGQPKAPETPKKLDIGVVAALGVAVGGITAALGALLGAFFGLGLWMPLGVLAILILISGPSMAIAWLKLRQRNLGPLLDANGWAINALTRVNVPLGRSFTRVATLPEGAERDLADPFAEKKQPWWLYTGMALILVLGLAWFIGKLDPYLPDAARSVTILGEAAPAHVKVPPPEPAPEAPAPPPAP